MITLSDNVQSERRDCIEFCPDLNIGVRFNGEEVSYMIDIAGNMYPAGIPAPTVAPSAALGAAAADRLPNGWYAYTYVYAAKNRYPLLDAGKAMQGSIAPRGNPAPYLVFQVTGGPRRVIVTVTGSERLDIDQIILYRTTTWATQSEAELAAKAGQMFSIKLLTNVLPDQNYNDDASTVTTTEQVEYDNHMAPTAQYAAYESPFLWAIGNDPLIKVVSWSGNVISLEDEGKWFEGRNGMLTTVTGITSGGIDGRGTFLFKAGDLDEDNLNNTCVLTKDGITAETLTPATGTGVIRIVGPATTLFRSKPRNPLAWGETIFIGTARDPKLFARRISGGRATAIAIVPGGEYLKIDVKDPAKSYTFSLRAAGTPAFEQTRRQIADCSISHHFSQFVASDAAGRKVLWGWDIDNHAILESDGNAQGIISHNVFNTLKGMQTEPTRAQYVEGFCNETTEHNILFMPWSQQMRGNDLAVYQHYPSQKWGTAMIGDMTATAIVRDPLTNLLRHLGGRDSGVMVEHQKATQQWNQSSDIWDIHSFVTESPQSMYIDTASFLPNYYGMWALWYCNKDSRMKYGRIVGVTPAVDIGNLTVFAFDFITEITNSPQSYGLAAELNAPVPGEAKLHVGCIPVVLEKVIELGNTTGLKEIESFSISGVIGARFLDVAYYGVGRLFIYSPDYETVERLPVSPPGASGQDAFDSVQRNQSNYIWEQVNMPKHGKISIRFAVVFFETLQLRTLNFDIR